MSDVEAKPKLVPNKLRKNDSEARLSSMADVDVKPKPTGNKLRRISLIPALLGGKTSKQPVIVDAPHAPLPQRARASSHTSYTVTVTGGSSPQESNSANSSPISNNQSSPIIQVDGIGPLNAVGRPRPLRSARTIGNSRNLKVSPVSGGGGLSLSPTSTMRRRNSWASSTFHVTPLVESPVAISPETPVGAVSPDGTLKMAGLGIALDTSVGAAVGEPVSALDSASSDKVDIRRRQRPQPKPRRPASYQHSFSPITGVHAVRAKTSYQGPGGGGIQFLPMEFSTIDFSDIFSAKADESDDAQETSILMSRESLDKSSTTTEMAPAAEKHAPANVAVKDSTAKADEPSPADPAAPAATTAPKAASKPAAPESITEPSPLSRFSTPIVGSDGRSVIVSPADTPAPTPASTPAPPTAEEVMQLPLLDQARLSIVVSHKTGPRQWATAAEADSSGEAAAMEGRNSCDDAATISTVTMAESVVAESVVSDGLEELHELQATVRADLVVDYGPEVVYELLGSVGSEPAVVGRAQQLQFKPFRRGNKVLKPTGRRMSSGAVESRELELWLVVQEGRGVHPGRVARDAWVRQSRMLQPPNVLRAFPMRSH